MVSYDFEVSMLNKMASIPKFKAPFTSASIQSPIIMLFSFCAFATATAYSKILGFGFAVDINGDGSTAVVSARLVSTEYTDTKVPVVQEVTASDDQISRERIYSKTVTFSRNSLMQIYKDFYLFFYLYSIHPCEI